MHPISKLLIEYNTSLYALQKHHGMQQPSLSRSINNDTPIERMNVGTIVQFAHAFGEAPETILRKLLDYEEETELEKLFYRNINTGVVINGKELKESSDANVVALWGEIKDDDYEKESIGVSNFDEYKAYLQSYADPDFVQCNEDGSDIDWANY
ncbi:helix-turn-helix domain-containing protein [Listeria booriae]|uniref:helix-turn-helix domain-containing protein n=1 Tax=Listeria booriae TaxID=1552123 RepID=UPI001623AB07|nr:helix-turn-helix domain-containing protein [Listeria booriae]MBC2103986.1 hypothetical protein [Listeria booriae]